MNDCSTSNSSSSSSSDSISNRNNSSMNISNKNKKLFPKKLWDLINNEKYYFCLRWSEDGQLVYLKRDSFENSYLKTGDNQFHTQKAISFVRQMNMYGFRKVDDCYYENDNFKRDCEHLLKNMIRKHPNKSQPGRPPPPHQQLITDDFPKQLLNTVVVSQPASGQLSASKLATNALEQSIPDLRTFYALLSSLSDNLCIQQANYQSLPLFDGYNLGGKFAASTTTLPQQIYHTLLAQQQQDDIGQVDPLLATTTKDHLPHLGGPTAPIQVAPKWTSSGQNPLDRATAATSLLAPSYTTTAACGAPENTANDLSLKNLRNNCKHLVSQTSGCCSDWSANREVANGAPTKRRQRDSRLVRSYKRSVDSILDSNDTDICNNIGSSEKFASPTTNKRTKLGDRRQAAENNKQQRQPASLVGGVNELAKNLVSEVALSRAAHLDSNVLLEASKYTESFVQTLFDTALVIARHSNGLNLSDYMLAADTANCPLPPMMMMTEEEKDDEEDEDEDENITDNDTTEEGACEDTFSGGQHDYERSNISVSDLTSALKLLPSKLLKILQ